MRAILFTLALSLSLAGCVSPSATDTPATDEVPLAPERVLPDAIEDTQRIQASADPLNFVDGTVCGTPSATCHRYAFDLNTTAKIDAVLSWSLPNNDFDLYVYMGDTRVSTDGASTPPGTTEAIAMDLEPGSYELVVVAWSVAQDTFTVKATFA